MTVTDYIARQTERIADSLAHFVASTPDDRLVWHPALEKSAQTRSVLEQITECIAVNRLIASILRGAEGVTGYPEVAVANGQDAQEQLVMSARELAAAIRALSPEDLTRSWAHPRGPMLGENIIMTGLRNMAYHAGQVNLIQLLYGDAEFHVPPTWR